MNSRIPLASKTFLLFSSIQLEYYTDAWWVTSLITSNLLNREGFWGFLSPAVGLVQWRMYMPRGSSSICLECPRKAFAEPSLQTAHVLLILMFHAVLYSRSTLLWASTQNFRCGGASLVTRLCTRRSSSPAERRHPLKTTWWSTSRAALVAASSTPTPPAEGFPRDRSDDHQRRLSGRYSKYN